MSALTLGDWTKEDRAAANREGWDLFECSGSEYGDLQIQKIDFPEHGEPEWDDDTDVWEFVGNNPTPLHVKALAILAADDPEEHEAVARWVSGDHRPSVPFERSED